MTSNQIKYAELREKKRANLEGEALERKKLAETIANNLRNYNLGISKNRLERLSIELNDERENKKIAETIRSNLAKELETNRHNLSDEEIKRMKNAVSSLKAKYDSSTILAALLGLMPDADIKALYGDRGASVSEATRSIVDFMLGKVQKTGEVTQSELSKSGKKKNPYGPIDYMFNKNLRYLEPAGPPKPFKYSEPAGPPAPKREVKDVNEIPTDFTQSRGPSVSFDAPKAPKTSFAIPSANEGGYQTSQPGKSKVYIPSGSSLITGPGV